MRSVAAELRPHGIRVNAVMPGAVVSAMTADLVLGDASYSIYLVHYMVLMVATKLIGSSPHGVVFNSVAIVLCTIAILALSILLYTYYESPARKWLRRMWS